METRRESSAEGIVISLSKTQMGASRFEAEKKYRLSLKIINDMKSEGLISEEEHANIDTKLRQKFNPISCEIL